MIRPVNKKPMMLCLKLLDSPVLGRTAFNVFIFGDFVFGDSVFGDATLADTVPDFFHWRDYFFLYFPPPHYLGHLFDKSLGTSYLVYHQ